MLKLATWNVNSLKIRLEQVLAWFEQHQIDILALQETKTPNENFPLAAFTERGYHVVYSGQKTYNGVAIISRQPIENSVTDIPDFDDPQRRILITSIGDLRLINLYVPNGAAVGCDKYHYKLHWLTKLNTHIQQELMRYPKLAVVGDFNIAPEDRDVHDPVAWEGSVLVSPQEREAFAALLALGLHDSFRLFPQPEKLYSWWDYRAAGFRRNHGLRIDHILLSAELAQACVSAQIDKLPRAVERPSDHTPVLVELNIS
ncbi:exodeoxyribonuclease III [Legionella beliardensis]|uniref:Exodeoxyribonuclease III n=1 Tax=Legionella beliardensis TaxID=91822 RepID=A0A378I3X9_9GAMM|nr:exodeoxyribonuclease III [Legionella beliardensis]STX29907.1 exodeoxyribonuclease III [Legionella beliardensis]